MRLLGLLRTATLPESSAATVWSSAKLSPSSEVEPCHAAHAGLRLLWVFGARSRPASTAPNEPSSLLATVCGTTRSSSQACQEETGVLTEQFSSREHDAFHVPHLSDTIREAALHGQAVKTVAYLRVSTPQQDASSQRLAIVEYARKHDLHIDDFIEATASGQASEKRRRLDSRSRLQRRRR